MEHNDITFQSLQAYKMMFEFMCIYRLHILAADI